MVDTPPVALGAGLPRRARAALQLPRRPVHPAAAGARPGPGQADERRPRRGDQRADEGAGDPGAARHADLRGGLRHAVRRVPAAGAEDLPAAPGRRYGVPGGRRAGAGRAARGGVLRGAAQRGADAAGRAGGQPRRTRARRAALGGAGAGRGRAARGGRRGRVPPRVCCGCTPTAPGSWPARHGCARGSRRRTRTCRRPSCRHCPRTCTTSTAFGWSATFSPRGPDRRARVRDPVERYA